ncbi:MAG: hypothetical protein ACE5QV_02225 [Fidelibacterota bacterium]
MVNVEIRGRAGNFDVLSEVKGSRPLIGQIVLEELDLIIDPKTKSLIPNPESPDTPIIEVLLAG